ncbi:hypothetical protein BDW62DRAFT_208402 [Aspergillus aurantiobrunneus]
MTELTTLSGDPFDRTLFEFLLKRRLFYTDRGLYDYGPPGCALQSNVVDLWRKHFVVQEDMLELDCTILTPEEVFKTSRHVDKFEDWMCKDSKKGYFLRADHLIETVLDSWLKGDKAARGLSVEVEKPETAQGQFLNSKKLLEYNQSSMPFVSASIGKSFRNGIAPRSGLLRVRGFLMAEIEHFVDPGGGKKHSKFDLVKELQLSFLNRSTQLAVSRGMVDNETLGYFLVRIYLVLLRISVDKKKVRFRQHMANEMAHYATDCWDAELQTSYGWIECVGCADRNAYDLTVHSRKTTEPPVVREPRREPLKVEEWQIDVNKAKLGPTFKKNARAVEAALTSLSQSERGSLAGLLEEKGVIEINGPDLPEKTEVSKNLVSIVKRTRIETVREYVPHVIESSFGIGRIFYSLLEHVCWHRSNDPARGVLSLPILVAPTKVLIVPLSTHPDFAPLTRAIPEDLRAEGISCRTDESSASIGKRYARNDELGIPLGVTIDFDSVKDGTITLRERDNTKQVRASHDDIFNAIICLINGKGK